MIRYSRNVILVLTSGDRSLLNKIPNWVYCENEQGFRPPNFCLVNRKENIKISFKQISDNTYRSLNVLPNNTMDTTIKEPQESDIHNDILFKLCLGVRKKFVDHEMFCGIIPCESDEI